MGITDSADLSLISHALLLSLGISPQMITELLHRVHIDKHPRPILNSAAKYVVDACAGSMAGTEL